MIKSKFVESLIDKYELLFDNSPLGICVTDVDGSINLNNTFCEMLGYTRSELLDAGWKDITYREDINKNQEIFDIFTHKSPEPKKTEKRFIKKDGSIIWTEITSKLINNDDGNPEYLVSMIRDISDYKNFERQLLENEVRYKELFDNNPSPMWLYDIQTLKFLMVNNAAVAHYGYSQEEFLNMTLKDIRPPEDVPELIKNLNGINSTIQDSGTWRHRKKDGTIILVKISSHGIKLNGYTARVTMAIDVTEKVASKQNLVTEAAKLKSIIESTADIIFSVDKDYCYTSFNSSHSMVMDNLYNTKIELGKNLFVCMTVDEDRRKAKANLDKALNGERVQEISISGDELLTQCYFDIIHNPVRDANGEVIGVSVFAKDVTESKRAIDKLEKREKEFQTLFQEDITGDFVSTPEGKIILCNRKFLNIFGFKSEEEALKTPIQFLYKNEEDRDRMKQRILNEKKLENLELELVRRDGKIIHILENIVGQFNKNGTLEKMFGYVIDITERKLAEEKLQESEERFRVASESLTDVIYDWDLKEKVDWYGDIDDITGYPPGGFPRTLEAWAEIVHQEDKDRVMAALEDHLKGLASYFVEYRVRRRNGEWRWWSARGTALRNDRGEPYKMIGSITDITERKLLVDALHTSEAKFRSYVDYSPQGIFVVNAKGQYIDSNEAAINQIGCSKEYLLQKTIADILPKEDLEKGLNLFNKLIKEGNSTGELSLLKTNGEKINVILDTVKISDDQFLGFSTDITERKQSEELLRESEERFRHSFDYAAIGICLVGAEGKFQKINNVFREMIGYEEDEIKNFTFSDITHPDDLSIGLSQLKKMLDGEIDSTSFEKRYIRKDRRIIWVYLSISLIWNVNHQPQFFITQIIDITERKRAEEALRDSEERYRSLIQSANDAIITTDEKGTILSSNLGAEKIFGYTEEEIIGKELSLIIPPVNDEKRIKEIELIELASEHPAVGKTIEMFGIHKNGKEFPLELSLSKWETSSGNYFTGIIRDITKRKLVESELIASKEKAEEMNRIKSNFLANMSHELRTPLVGILGFADILSDSLTDEFEKEMAASILQSGKRLLNTLSSILSLTEFETLKHKNDLNLTNVNLLCSDIINFYKINSTNKNVEFKTEFQSDPLELKINNRCLRETLNQLVKNSVTYTQSGFILVKTYKRVDPITLNSFGVIEVIDSGIGIPKEKQEIIFEEFRQVSEGHGRNFEGTGLGLTLSKKYLELMNGTITVESEEGKGTKFIISFPIGIECKSESLINKNTGKVDEVKRYLFEKVNSKIKNKRILLVEDDVLNRKFIEKCLTNFCDYNSVTTGEQAVKFSIENKFDLILMDINLGTNMDGITAVQIIRKIDGYEKTPIVAMTAYASDDDKKEFLTKGCSHYISKPFLMKGIVELVNRIFSEEEVLLNSEVMVN